MPPSDRLHALKCALRPAAPAAPARVAAPPAAAAAAAAVADGVLPRYCPADLRAFGAGLLEQAGMEAGMARIIAQCCVEGDLLNHSTHGMRLLFTAIDGVLKGTQACAGEPTVLRDTGSTLSWDGAVDGRPLNGLYLTHQAVAAALARAHEHGVATVVVRRSGHTGCLQAFLEAATSDGCMLIIASSGLGVRSVAPFGGTTGTLHPNPFAVGIPATPYPILVCTHHSMLTLQLLQYT